MALLPLLCTPPHPKPSLLGLDQVIAEAWSSDTTLRQVLCLHLDQIVLFTARCVWDHSSVEKKDRPI